MFTLARNTDRDLRQLVVREWVARVIGRWFANDKPERGRRLVEEAIELAQAVGTPKADVIRLVNYVYSRPAGEIEQEIGGVSVCLLALAAACNVDADLAEKVEINRAVAMDRMKIRAKQIEKAAAGITYHPDRPGEGELKDPTIAAKDRYSRDPFVDFEYDTGRPIHRAPARQETSRRYSNGGLVPETPTLSYEEMMHRLRYRPEGENKRIMPEARFDSPLTRWDGKVTPTEAMPCSEIALPDVPLPKRSLTGRYVTPDEVRKSHDKVIEQNRLRAYVTNKLAGAKAARDQRIHNNDHEADGA